VPDLIVSPRVVAAACMAAGIPQTRALDIWRAMGGQIREVEWAKVWREETEFVGRLNRERQTG